MCMDQVEVICPTGDFLDKRCLNSHGVGARTTESKGPGADGVELSAGHGIPARKERPFMTHLDELVYQPCDDPFSASVELGGTLSAKGAICAILIGFPLP